MQPTPILAPDYYLANFKLLITWVAERYHDLLSYEERSFIEAFHALSHASQCLFVRLSSRKGTLFRNDKLSYAEITPLELAAQELIDCGFMIRDMRFSVMEVCQLLTKPELVNCFLDELRPYRSERKENLIALLAKTYLECKSWQEWTKGQSSQVYGLTTKMIINNFLLLFFGNSYQDLTEFVLQDIGIYRYENYSIDHHHRVFKSREELEQYQHITLLREHLTSATTLEQLVFIAEQLPTSPASTIIEKRLARLCSKLAYEFERFNQYSIALSLYQQCQTTRERKVRVLEKLGDHTLAWEHLLELIKTPINEQELQIAERMAPRLAKKLGESYTKKAIVPITEKYLSLTPAVLTTLTSTPNNEMSFSTRVEEVARLNFEAPEAPCLYVENDLINGLFGLWLWPEIFRNVDGAFANPFQTAPLDMYETNFSVKRPLISELWQALEDGTYTEHIHSMWTQKNGISNHFVNWHFLDEATLRLALLCIPAQHLKLIFERILFDIKNNRSGLPDLIQFYPTEKTYRMLEIKGPGDRIQDNQRRWLEYFSTHNIPAEVIYVAWQ